MNTTTRILLLGAACLFAASCAGQPVAAPQKSAAAAPPPAASEAMDSLLWTQTSAEYRAVVLGTYHAATARLRAIAKHTKKHTKPLAVVVDVDDTILNNTPYMAHLLLSGTAFSPASWDAWVARRAAAPIPGAVEFANTATNLGVHMFYVTNRKCEPRPGDDDVCPQRTDTFENLRKAGITKITLDDVMLYGQNGWPSEKEVRRNVIAKKYDIVMMAGDQLSDFVTNIAGKSRAARDKAVIANEDHWGHDWFMIANPVYGDYSSTKTLGGSKKSAIKGY